MKSFGFLPDDAGLVALECATRHVSKLVSVEGASADTLPESCVHVDFVQTIPDQLNTSSCVGHAFATALETLSYLQGKPIPRPSAATFYTMGRRVMVGPFAGLKDAGVNPTSVLEALIRYGIVSEARAPFDPRTINAPIPMDVFQHAVDARLGGHYRIPSGFAPIGMRVLRPSLYIRQALVKRYIPVYRQVVDDAYCDLAHGRGVYVPGGEVRGQHMQAIVGYEGADFLIAGSWGRSWAANGFARVSADFIDDPRNCGDFLVPTILPAEVS